MLTGTHANVCIYLTQKKPAKILVVSFVTLTVESIFFICFWERERALFQHSVDPRGSFRRSVIQRSVIRRSFVRRSVVWHSVVRRWAFRRSVVWCSVVRHSVRELNYWVVVNPWPTVYCPALLMGLLQIKIFFFCCCTGYITGFKVCARGCTLKLQHSNTSVWKTFLPGPSQKVRMGRGRVGPGKLFQGGFKTLFDSYLILRRQTFARTKYSNDFTVPKDSYSIYNLNLCTNLQIFDLVTITRMQRFRHWPLIFNRCNYNLLWIHWLWKEVCYETTYISIILHIYSKEINYMPTINEIMLNCTQGSWLF
jgi:hypothetical protein